jgi:hypothetical protein
MEHAHQEQVEHQKELASPGGAYEKDEVGRLQEEAESLSQQIAEVQKRIKRMKSKGSS